MKPFLSATPSGKRHTSFSAILRCLPAGYLFVALLLIYASGCAQFSGIVDGTFEGEPPEAGTEAPASQQDAEPEVDDKEAAAIESANVFYETAERFHAMGDDKNALANYRKALSHHAQHHHAQFRVAEILAEEQEQEAIRILKDLLSKLHFVEDTRHVRKIRAEAEGLLLGLDEMGLALASGAAVLTKYGEDAQAAGRHENALELYRRALALWPASTEARTRAYRLCKKHGFTFPDELIKAVVRETYLEQGELTPASVTVKRGTLLANETKWGLPFYNQGESLKQGLWAPAPSRITYDLKKGYKRFKAKIFVTAFDGEKHQVETLERELRKPGAGTVRFGIAGDGKTIFDSGVVTYGSGIKEIDIDISGVETLILEVLDADGSTLLDFAVWAEGRFFM